MRVRENRAQGPTVLWLLDRIEEFLTLNELPNDGCLFGAYVSNDRSLVERLREGGDVTTSKMDEILAYMQNPVKIVRTGIHRGYVREIPIKPLTIKRKELP